MYVIVKSFYKSKMFDKLISNLQNISEIDIVGITSKYVKCAELKRTPKDTVMEYNTFQSVKLYREGKVNAFIFPYDVDFDLLNRGIDEFLLLGVNPKDVYVATPEFFTEQDMKSLCAWEDFSCLPYVEFHVADHCNLNCKGCVHFSPLVGKEVFPKYETIEKDFNALKRIVKYVKRIHILGGEPLLNKELYRYVDLVKSVYPDSELSIVTNGILITEMPRSLQETMKKNEVKFSVSLYPPLFQHMEKICKYLDDCGIEYTYSDPIHCFAYTFNSSGGLAKGADRQNCTCPNLYQGKIYICPIIAYGKYFNHTFGEEIDTKQGAIDIYDPAISFDRLKKLLYQVVPLCDKCLYISKEKARYFGWKQSGMIEKNDYVLGE